MLENNRNEYDGVCTKDSFPITLYDGISGTPIYTISSADDEGAEGDGILRE